MKIQILVDNIKSWYVPYAVELKDRLKDYINDVSIIHNHNDVVEGDILCLIGCEKIFRIVEQAYNLKFPSLIYRFLLFVLLQITVTLFP